MTKATDHQPVDSVVAPWRSYVGASLSVVALAAVFFVVSLIRAPIPGVNESHYLGKARHFWQPEWCQGDLFLESANPHAVFYAAFGWMTTQWPLETVALILRAAQSALLAWGWMALGWRVSRSLLRTLTAAALFLCWQASGTWSGEWLIGGAESKVWAYGCLMLAAAWGLDRRWLASAVAGGLAVSFHPVVGCWGLLIAGMAWGWSLFSPKSLVRDEASRTALSEKPAAVPSSWLDVSGDRQMVALAGLLFVAAALPGLIPAVRSLSAPSREVANEADYLQVAVRLPHHLDPLTFPVRAWRDYGLLLLVWWLLRARTNSRVGPKGEIQKTIAPWGAQWLDLWMVASLLIAAGGLLAAWGPRPFKEMPLWELRAKALKLYPFRLGDMLVPIAVCYSISAVLWSRRTVSSSSSLPNTGKWAALRERYPFWTLMPTALSVGAVVMACRLPIADKILATQSPATQADWRAACDWIRRNTPPDSVFYAMNDNWSLRWFAERPEYFHFKDCPQDAKSIVEWHRRYELIVRWRQKTFADGRCSRAELADLGLQTGITYLSCAAYTPMDTRPVFASPYYRIYRIPTGQ